MENKTLFKKYFIVTLLICIFSFVAFSIFNAYRFSQIKRMTNERISSIVSAVKEKYPDVKNSDLVEVLEKGSVNKDILREFGYDFEEDIFIIGLEEEKNQAIFIGGILLCGSLGSLLFVFVLYNCKVNREVRKIISLVNKINHHNYELEIETYSEDELSILKSEIYKTTIMLKEVADNSLKDKVQLKNTLADISHQLKTPLTSITIMLEAILDDEEMDKEIRTNFLKDIKRDIANINFLVQSLLKLSKFDANAIHFINSTISLQKIVRDSIKNIESLCDLKKIDIDVVEQDKICIEADLRWQVEAVTNILKNCVDYSPESSNIVIRFESNKIYSSIIVEDHGKGIDKKDLSHIFERFYKGRNSSKDSVGIGLALAKSIVEQNGGHIFVDSEVGRGTTFKINYYLK